MKCETPGCKNQDYQGKFEGNLCSPCYHFYNDILENKTSFKEKNSQAYRNLRELAKGFILSTEMYKVHLKFKDI